MNIMIKENTYYYHAITIHLECEKWAKISYLQLIAWIEIHECPCPFPMQNSEIMITVHQSLWYSGVCQTAKQSLSLVQCRYTSLHCGAPQYATTLSATLSSAVHSKLYSSVWCRRTLVYGYFQMLTRQVSLLEEAEKQVVHHTPPDSAAA